MQEVVVVTTMGTAEARLLYPTVELSLLLYT